MTRLLIAIAIILVVLATALPMPNRAEAVSIPAARFNTADGIDIFKPAQIAPEQRQRTEYGTLRSGNRPQPACHWERNYQTGTSSWVCRAKKDYGVVYPRIREFRRPR
ncbi:MAG: hypothetical protein HY659_08995 [Rhizobiales bacterium]|nr:hypothetical protein [Hyphomicrobiales bacterium]